MWVTRVSLTLGNGGRRLKMETRWKPGVEPRPLVPEETAGSLRIGDQLDLHSEFQVCQGCR